MPDKKSRLKPGRVSGLKAGVGDAPRSAREFQIIQGDALSVLRTMPAESIHCVVTSPPYWGLRDYGVPGQVWGGDPNHSHEWGAEIDRHATNHTDKRRWNHARNGRGEEQPKHKRPGSVQHVKQGCYCACGAWFGVLGLEPTIDLYVAHIVEVFREVRRVLKADGTIWVNLGDSYCSDAGADRMPTTLAGARVPSGWTTRAQPHRVHALRKGKDKDPKRGEAADTSVVSGVVGLKPKDLMMMPARVAIALQDDGWYLRSDIIWHKPNPMPESVKDRPTKSHEYLFLLSKSATYFYDADAIKEPASAETHARYAKGDTRRSRAAAGQKTLPTAERNGIRAPGVNPKSAMNAKGSRQNASFSAAVKDIVETRNKRTVWTLPTQPFPGAHFATFPENLVEPCILAGCPEGGTVLDPFAGVCTVGVVALRHGRSFVGIELKPEYAEMARLRIRNDSPMFNEECKGASNHA